MIVEKYSNKICKNFEVEMNSISFKSLVTIPLAYIATRHLLSLVH